MLLVLLQQGLSVQEIIYLGIILIFAMTLSFSFHEFMHAAVAVWLGDETPRNMGRLTLNPLAHIDPVGAILLLLAGFGWGKPVMYNPNRLNRFKSDRAMNIMVHLAGVTGNLIIALLASIVCGCMGAILVVNDHIAFQTILLVMLYTISFSLMLLAFNLLPIPPLDGFHVLEELLPYKVRSSQGYLQFQRYSPLALWVLFLAGTFMRIPLLSWIIEIIEYPFSLLCGLIQSLFFNLVHMLV